MAGVERKEKRRREEREEIEGQENGNRVSEDLEEKVRKKKKESKKEKKSSSRHLIHRSLIHDPDQQSSHKKDDSISTAESKESEDVNLNLSRPGPPPEVTTTATSKSDFFAKLFAKEKLAPPVGTFHATGKKSDEAHAPHESTTDWLCPKCNTSNYRHSHQCQKCKAVKRLSVWR
jgi:hypothetical protein